MNYRGISFYLSLFCLPVSVLAFLNILYSSYFDYFLSINSYLVTLIISLIVSSSSFFIGRKSKKKLSFIEQLILIILIYLVVSFLVSLPFYLSNYQVTFINALFESISGLTTTGFSIFSNIKYLDPTLIIWRSSLQWIGGLYFLFFLIFIFSNKQFNYKMTNLTFSGDGNVKELLFKTFILYLVLSFIIFLLLNIFDVRMFNSLNLSMSLIASGGFLPTNSLNKIIQTNSQKIIFIFSLLVSFLNFFIILNIFEKRTIFREHKEDFYLFLLSIALILPLYLNSYNGIDTVISVLSSLSNSGLSLLESNNNLGLYFLLITILGGSLISNTSGIKFLRVYILLKSASSEIKKLVSPNSIINKNILNSERKITNENITISFLIFISFIISLFLLSSILVFDNISFEKSFKLSILTLTNTMTSAMYGIDDIDFANLLTSSKLSLIMFMIIGKIELISIFLIFKKLFLRD